MDLCPTWVDLRAGLIQFQARAAPAELPIYRCPHTKNMELETQSWIGGVSRTNQISLATYHRILPPTLHKQDQASTTDCSKTLRGLRFPMEVSGMCTRTAGSLSSSLGQWGPRSTIHAGRYLSGKAFRYLKRVIVTPAVYWRFTALNCSFTCQHWAGVALSTHPFGLAESYVFIKQSGPPSHWDQLLSKLAPLIPKLRGYFADFPKLVYLNTP